MVFFYMNYYILFEYFKIYLKINLYVFKFLVFILVSGLIFFLECF